MKKLATFCLLFFSIVTLKAQTIPLPEHPRPDFERSEWINLNGSWKFEFDSLNKGIDQNWESKSELYTKTITVPFPWGSKLSGVKDEADIAWYGRNINVPESWQNKKTFFTIGASDWHTTVWLDGNLLGEHKGGYTPFSFDLSPYLVYGQNQKLVVRVDDARRMFTLYGKQGYGNARGIWQTAYLEARGKTHFDHIHFVPNIDSSEVTIKGEIIGEVDDQDELKFAFNKKRFTIKNSIKKDGKFSFTFPITDARLWTLEDPFLYDATLSVKDDEVKTYFGMRKISVVNLPGTDIPYIALNNKPIYLQLTLDQSYHPDGFYTFPSDEFMKNEIQLCKDIGLNGLRTHIKVDIPRKLYWADKLGLLVMADLPNSWGEPDLAMQKESEYTLREMIKRDFNHPAIFSWITFNESWGLRTKTVDPKTKKSSNIYLPETQYWVASMYYLAKSLDQTRLVEDNSICCGAGHTETDINSWHEYLPGYAWEDHMSNLVKNTYPGSQFHFEKGFTQGNQPMINSECGNVWGYEGSTGDVDWSYDYHQMMNVFRKYPQMAGWLYTEHHDVINEWNGYWRFDRSPKYTGLEELGNGMKDSDFHSLIYISTGNEITRTVEPNTTVEIPLYFSSMTDQGVEGDQLTVDYWINGVNYVGNTITTEKKSFTIPYKSWMQETLKPISIQTPSLQGVYQVIFEVKDANGKVHHRNFFSLDVPFGRDEEAYQVFEVKPTDWKKENWSNKVWSEMEGAKMNAAGNGYIEYEFTGDPKRIEEIYFLAELGGKQLFAKDRDEKELGTVEYMLGGKAEPSKNKNSYPMSDADMKPSQLGVSIDGSFLFAQELPDDPADHRGILSWHRQNKDKTLHEAGSYGYLIKVPFTSDQVKTLKKEGKIRVRLASTNGGGLAIYGKDFGRYAFNPSIVVVKK
ncbi:Glycosyl hydrolases family 2 [Spirosomataceae bacterium TFI 002]|nr:Glycosyl hydrolases family 2 [Spirosomataceae bacterium TFI 002]